MGSSSKIWLTCCCVALGLAVASQAFCQWQYVGLDGYDVRGIAFRAQDRDTAYASVYYNDKGIYHSTDEGFTWSLVASLAWATDVDVDPADKDRVYAIFSEAIYRSDDAGDTWIQKDAGFSFGSGYSPGDIAVSPTSPESVYVTTSAMTGGGELFCSGDNADSWSEVDMPWVNGKGAIGIDPTQAGKMFVAVHYPGNLGHTMNSGSSWADALSEIVDDVSVSPANGNVVYVASGGEVYRSLDGGGAWTAFGATDGLADYITVVDVNPVNSAVVYAAGGNSVFRSTDGGTTWTDFSDGLPAGVFINSLAVEGETGEVVLLGTYQEGIYRRNCSLSGVVPEPDRMPGRLVIDKTSPNPFANRMEISFSAPRAAVATLSVYDIQGRLVTTLASDAGTESRTLIWNGSNSMNQRVSPGIYVLRLSTGDARDSRTVVLSR